ncbi:MAG: T9SS type A sorting domain-containing protein [Ginsengibacter sp.]
MNPRYTAKSCAGNPVYLSDTVSSYFNNYVNYCWEKSTDNGVTWVNTEACGIKVPTLVNGLWQYIVDTIFTATAVDSGAYYRVKVATTIANLNDKKCSVDNSQKVFLKIYNINCIVLNASEINFKGKLQNEKALLTWNGENDNKTKSFELQKSSDGINFSSIAIIPANLKYPSNYSYTDPESLHSKNYYRIRVIPNGNDATQLSQVISLFENKLDFRMTVVNPFRNILKIETSSPSEGIMDVILCDTYGKVVIQKLVHTYQGATTLSLDETSRLSAGIYILRVSCNGKILQQKLFKL